MNFLIRWQLPILIMLGWSRFIYIGLAIVFCAFICSMFYHTVDNILSSTAKMTGRKRISVSESFKFLLRW